VVSVPPGAVRVTLTIWETLAVASAAVTVIVLTPTPSGIFDITQFEPLIDDPSDEPMLLLQLTAGEPLPPVMVPESDIVVAVVVAGGALIVSTRAPGGGATVRITLTTREMLALEFAAVTVIVLSPIASGILDVTQFAPLIEDPPDSPVFLIQVTKGASVPPVTVPEIEIVVEVVVAGGISSVRASGLAVRVTLAVPEMLPVESTAVTMMVLSPTFSGILNMDQFAPLTVALSAAPVTATQVKTGVPLAPVMVPDNEIAAEVVAAGGMLIVRASATGGGEMRFTLTVWTTDPSASVAVTVMVLSPINSGMFKATQFTPLSEAVPDPPALETHVTATSPVPPVAVPTSKIVGEEAV